MRNEILSTKKITLSSPPEIDIHQYWMIRELLENVFHNNISWSVIGIGNNNYWTLQLPDFGGYFIRSKEVSQWFEIDDSILKATNLIKTTNNNIEKFILEQCLFLCRK